MDKIEKQIDDLDARILNLEMERAWFRGAINRLLCAHGENAQTPADAPPLKPQCHGK